MVIGNIFNLQTPLCLEQAPQVRFETRVNLGCVGQNGVVSFLQASHALRFPEDLLLAVIAHFAKPIMSNY